MGSACRVALRRIPSATAVRCLLHPPGVRIAGWPADSLGVREDGRAVHAHLRQHGGLADARRQGISACGPTREPLPMPHVARRMMSPASGYPTGSRNPTCTLPRHDVARERLLPRGCMLSAACYSEYSHRPTSVRREPLPHGFSYQHCRVRLTPPARLPAGPSCARWHAPKRLQRDA